MKALSPVARLALLWLVLFTASAGATDYSATARVDTLLWNCRVIDNSSVISVHKRVTILNEAGSGFAECTAYESPYVSIKALQVQVFDQTGKRILNHSKKDLTKACGFGSDYTLYQENCTFDETPTASSFPFSVVFDNTYEIKSNFFLHGTKIDRSIPMDFGSFELSFPVVNPIHYKTYQIVMPAVESVAGGMKHVNWTVANLAAEEDEDNRPPLVLDGSRIALYPERYRIGDVTMPTCSWKELGLVYKALSDGRYLPMPTSISKPVDPESARQSADSIYSAQIRSTRYVAVNIGLSGWQPELASKTLVCGYGDCKGLTGLLVSHLRQAGIVAFPCLVLTNDEGAPDTTFVNDEFNHVIATAIIGKDTVWYDPTCEVCPAGMIPPHDQNNDVLVITDTGGVLVHTPGTRAENSRWQRMSDITVDSAGMTTISVTATLTGHCAITGRRALQGSSTDEKRRYIERIFRPAAGNYNVDQTACMNLDSTNIPLILSARLRSTRPLDHIGSVTYLLPFVVIRRTLGDDEKWDIRSCAIYTGYPITVTDSVVLRSPLTAKCDSLLFPRSDSVMFEQGGIRTSFSRNGDEIIGVLTEWFNEWEIPVAGISTFRKYVPARTKMVDRPIKWFGSVAH